MELCHITMSGKIVYISLSVNEILENIFIPAYVTYKTSNVPTQFVTSSSFQYFSYILGFILMFQYTV